MAPSSSSVLWGEFRRGLKDLQNAVLNPWNGVTQTHEEPGTIANPTMQMVTEDIRGDVHGRSIVDQYAERVPRTPDRPLERE